MRSPSSRRAWIEIFNAGPGKAPDEVALLAEGVDRNEMCYPVELTGLCRPPRGGRG